jgi:tRNA-splicing ligase RtcB (3'-phosphate/5'-hydroxy nucleic acid ligase)
MINGQTLIQWGYKPGSWFGAALAAAGEAEGRGAGEIEIREVVAGFAPGPTVPLREAGLLGHFSNISAESEEEIANVAGVEKHMRELMRVPTVRAGAVMPDACPAGAQSGTIPVGGVIAAENAIHPGMHSADICCSMAVSIFSGRDVDPVALLDAGMKLSHFGGGGRPAGDPMAKPPIEVLDAFAANPFLRTGQHAAVEHFATQGDGNHFFYVGRVRSSGEVALVTHHGSRKPGAMLYKAGMIAAERVRAEVSPETPAHNAWIVAQTREGADYWSALQTVRAWTKASHYAIHDAVAEHLGLEVVDRFWNEHNFVFRKSDGLFYHAKGATPAWPDFASDSSGLTLIPLNMGQPVLIARGLNAPNGLGFAPHGAGRNSSRSAYLKRHAGKTAAQMMAEQTSHIDARFYCGIPDVSELPLAYKDATTVRRQIQTYGLAEIVETIEPIGCIMAGDWQQNAPWRVKKANRDAGRASDQL